MDKAGKKPKNYILRYWEKEFKEIKPTIINKQRYYTHRQINKIKIIKFLLKDKGMTIKGVKSALNSSDTAIDETKNLSIKKRNLKLKLEKISDLIKNLKN